MAPKTAQAKAHAFHQPRDSHGHFVKSNQIKSDFKASSPADIKLNPEFEKPLVTVSISNPLHKIMYWLDQIRRHQTTTLAIKLSIPLIVIPVIIAAAFTVGRISGIGTINQNPTPLPSRPPVALGPITTSRAGILKVAKSPIQTSYVLSLQNGEILVLEVPTTIDLTKYANKQILVTGLFTKTTNTLKVSEIAQIEVYNTTTLPAESTPSAN